MKAFVMCFVAVLVLLCIAGSLSNAGVTDSRSAVGGIEKITLAWTASGGASGYVRGFLQRVVITAHGSTNDVVDLTLKDENGIDLLNGAAVSVATNTATSFAPGQLQNSSGVSNAVPYAVNDKLTIAVTTGGTNTTGTAVLYVRP